MVQTPNWTVLTRYLATGWFAVLTVCGHAFHDHGHGHGHRAGGGHPALHDHDHCGGHDAAPGAAVAEADGCFHGPGTDVDACLTCVFFAQAQLQANSADVVESDIPPSLKTRYGTALVAAGCVSCFDSRGPPLLLLLA